MLAAPIHVKNCDQRQSTCNPRTATVFRCFVPVEILANSHAGAIKHFDETTIDFDEGLRRAHIGNVFMLFALIAIFSL